MHVRSQKTALRIGHFVVSHSIFSRRWGPTADGKVIEDDVLSMFQRGDFFRVQMMAGTNAQEGNEFTPLDLLENGTLADLRVRYLEMIACLKLGFMLAFLRIYVLCSVQRGDTKTDLIEIDCTVLSGSVQPARQKKKITQISLRDTNFLVFSTIPVPVGSSCESMRLVVDFCSMQSDGCFQKKTVSTCSLLVVCHQQASPSG